MNYGYTQGYYPQYQQGQNQQQMQQNNGYYYNQGNQQGGYTQQMQYTQPQQQIVYVASMDEVKAHPVDWTGGITYFVDKVNSCIYTKQLGDNGIPDIKVYKLDNLKDEKIDYVTREEFDKVKEVLDNLLKQLGGVTNEQ